MQLRQSAFACIARLYLRSTVRKSKAAAAAAKRIRTRRSPAFPLPTFVSIQEITNEETP